MQKIQSPKTPNIKSKYLKYCKLQSNFDLVGKFESYMDNFNVFVFGKFIFSTTTWTRY